VTPGYAVRRATRAIARNPYVALVGTTTIFVAVFVTGLFAATLGGAERVVGAWAGEVQLSVYLAPGADLVAARDAAVRIAAPYAVEAVPGPLALERLRANLGDEAGVLEGVPADALPDAVEVRAPGISLADARVLGDALRAVPGADEVDYGNLWLERLERFVRLARTAGLALLAALALATAVLVSNTLRLAVFARRDEIEIMKLVGATDGFVRAPFLIEGVVQGLAGAGLATIALVAAHAAILPRLRAAVHVAGGLTMADTLPWSLVFGLLGAGGVIGLLASALAVARALRNA
jgi:cell division transport system permease protein